MSTPSNNTRLAKKQALLKDAATTTSVSEGVALATPKSATKKPKGTPKKTPTPVGKKSGSTKKTPKAKKEEETTETAVVAANSFSTDFTKIVGRIQDRTTVMRKENAAFQKTTTAKLQRLRDGQKLLVEQQKESHVSVRRNHQWTKDQFAARDGQIATLRNEQTVMGQDVGVLFNAVQMVDKKNDRAVRAMGERLTDQDKALKFLFELAKDHSFLSHVLTGAMFVVLHAVIGMADSPNWARTLSWVCSLYPFFGAAKILYRRFSQEDVKAE